MDELEKSYLLSLTAIKFGTNAKVEKGKRIAKMDWNEFQNIAMYFYQLGKESVDK